MSRAVVVSRKNTSVLNKPARVKPERHHINGAPAITSVQLAELLKREHKDVLRSIRNMGFPVEISRRIFVQPDYIDSRGNPDMGKTHIGNQHLQLEAA